MIKFFGKIHYELMGKNKTGKYLKYAIGEIILVVIGILIALSINNWNENRKLHQEELNLLIEVKSNLEVTLNNFKKDTLFNLNTIHEFRKIEQYIDKKLPYNPELNNAFALIRNWQSPYPITTSYATLKTKGIDLIKNANLRNSIVHFYEYELVVLYNDYDKGEWAILEASKPYLNKHIRYKNSKQAARPNDFENLKLEVEFTNIIGNIIDQREFGILTYKAIMTTIKGLIVQIDNELIARN
jgi:hypothetical protein